LRREVTTSNESIRTNKSGFFSLFKLRVTEVRYGSNPASQARMTNDEFQMTKEIPRTNLQQCQPPPFCHWCFVIISSFVIRHLSLLNCPFSESRRTGYAL